jgi:hypothetical protein
MGLLERVTLNPNPFSPVQNFLSQKIWFESVFRDGHVFRSLKWFDTTLGFLRETLALILAFIRLVPAP